MFGVWVEANKGGEDFIKERVTLNVQVQFRYEWSGFLFLVFTVVHVNLVAHAKSVKKESKISDKHVKASLLNLTNNPQMLETTKSACQNDLCFTARVATESTLMVLKFVQHVVHKLHTRNRSGGWGGGGDRRFPRAKWCTVMVQQLPVNTGTASWA